MTRLPCESPRRQPEIRELAATYQGLEAADPVPSGRTLSRAINRDARPDVVVRAAGTLRALLGDDGPCFRPASAPGAPAGDFDVVTGVGDVDGDGSGDLLVRRATTGTFEVRATSETQTFARVIKDGSDRFATDRTLTGSPDLTGDGRPDLLVTTETGVVKVAASQEGAGFAVARLVSRDWGEHRAVLGAGDLDRDGIGDLLLIDSGGVVWFAAGDANLTYADPVRLGGGWLGRTAIAAGHDLTGDGMPDLLARVTATGRTWIWPGDGRGGLGAPIGGWTGWGDARTVTTTSDVTGDGFADAVVVNARDRLTTRESRHGMWLRPSATIAGSWSSCRWLSLAGDWDGDGFADLVGVEGDRLWLLRGRGNGRYHPRVGGWPGWDERYHLMAANDWSGDGRPDLLSKQDDGTVWLHSGRGTEGTANPRPLGVVGQVSAITAVGPWDGDRIPDLVTRQADDTLMLWPGRGNKPLAAGVPLLGGRGFDRYDRILGAGDLTGDGRPDLLARSSSSGMSWILPGSRTGVGERIRVADGWGSHTLIG
ncbi:MAG: VCBS repeat-containing protein [Actinomycetota bacterium]|nr:VCBS repeat-containing protein [Actinomycetota bacterium]